MNHTEPGNPQHPISSEGGGRLPGRTVDGDALASHEPATGALVWQGRSGDIERCVAQARQGWPQWAALPHVTRIEWIRRFANEVRKDRDTIAELVARETGRPLWDARGEIEDVLVQVEAAIAAYAERTAQRRRDNGRNGITALRHKPHGVALVLAPASAPAQAACSQIVPALIAGNTVIFKPSERTPATGEALAACFHRGGIPASALLVCQGGPDLAHVLAVHEDIDAVFFSGSAANGVRINRALADQPEKLVSLSMGGNNPCIAWDTPHVSDAAALIVHSAFASAGQRANAVRRLIVRDALADDLIAEIKALADRLIVGAPFDDPQPWMGPLVDNAAADTVALQFLDLMNRGGRPLKHLVRRDHALPYLTPAIIDVTDVRDCPDSEIFGPVLQVVRVSDFDDAIAQANATRYGLAALLVGGTPDQYNRFWANVRAGMVHWNRSTAQPWLAAPQGGIGLSGNFRPSGTYAADACAYPVTSAELEEPRASIGIGIADET